MQVAAARGASHKDDHSFRAVHTGCRKPEWSRIKCSILDSKKITDGFWLVDTKYCVTPHCNEEMNKDEKFRTHTPFPIPRGLFYWTDDLCSLPMCLPFGVSCLDASIQSYDTLPPIEGRFESTFLFLIICVQCCGQDVVRKVSSCTCYQLRDVSIQAPSCEGRADPWAASFARIVCM